MVTIIEKLGSDIDKPNYIKVKIRNGKEEDLEEVLMHEDQVTLLETLSRLQKSTNIYPDSMNEIWKQIRKYARSEYSVGFEAGLEIDNEEEKS